jgi:pyridoxine 5'-phosphate synthase PdxJ
MNAKFVELHTEFAMPRRMKQVELKKERLSTHKGCEQARASGLRVSAWTHLPGMATQSALCLEGMEGTQHKVP